jgi:para-aminobenzoate synthetase
MTGSPKIRTCEIIEQLEGFPRGIYSGVIGYFSVNGFADFSVVIRTAVFREQNVDGVSQTNVSVGAGGAIVILSQPEDEFEEMQLKADSVLSSFR